MTSFDPDPWKEPTPAERAKYLTVAWCCLGGAVAVAVAWWLA